MYIGVIVCHDPMKEKMEERDMTRTAAREIAVRLAYELGYTNESAQAMLERFLDPEHYMTLSKEDKLYTDYPDEKTQEYLRKLVIGVGEHAYELDGYIEKYAIGWSFERIPRVATAIMRVAMYELLYMPDTPRRTIIHAAVRIAEHYEDAKVVSFINGILGKFLRTELPEEAEQ
jgi:N utilization substance protein B